MNGIRGKTFGALIAAGFLAGCQFLPAPEPKGNAIPPRQVNLLEGRIVVPAPQGYCVDQASLKAGRQDGFALISGCDALMGLPSGTIVPSAIMTVAALLPDQPLSSAQDLAEVLQADRVLAHQQKDGLTLLHLDAPDLVPDDSAPEHWRGAMVVNGVILTLAIYGNDEIANGTGSKLLQELATRIRSSSPQLDPATLSNTPKKSKNLFQRIFN